MRKVLSILLLVVSVGMILAQISSFPDYWTINIFVGRIQGYSYRTPMISTAQTDTLMHPNIIQPVIFQVHDKNDSTKFTSINQYLHDYGTLNADGDYEIEYFPMLERALNSYWAEMFKDLKTSTWQVFPKKLRFNYIYGEDGNPWLIERLSSHEPYSDYYSAYLEKFRNNMQLALGDSIWNSLNDRSIRQRQLSVMLLPSISVNYPYSYTNYFGTVVYLMYRPDHPDQTNRILAHEFGHLIANFHGNGTEGSGGFQYNGQVQTDEGLELTGQTYGSTGPYDIMHSSGGISGNAPNMLYGIAPYFTEDLINITMAYTSSNIVVPPTDFQHKIVKDSLQNNKTEIRLKAIREELIPEDYGNVFQALSIPITNDIAYLGEPGPNANYVENQKFLIELRNGKRFDNFSPMYSNETSKGILISHIIRHPNQTDLKLAPYRIADIECAVSFPDTNISGQPYRDPELAWTDSNSLSKNGIWYFGKKINDWLDDHAPNAVYPFEGGKGTWHKDSLAVNNHSIPTDFFNDTDRNKFTPSTRPNTNSWKGAETNIGIFIDKIEGDYADLRIYRNYHSVPLTRANAKLLPDGNNGLSIMNDGYIGEKFYVDSLTWLYLGTKDTGLPNDFTPTTTLVPGTNMHVKDGGYLQLKNDSKLRLENSKLEFRNGSTFKPISVAGIEIDNSELTFENGVDIDIKHLNSYKMEVSNSSSFYNSYFYMKGPSVLTLSDNSVFTILDGSNVTLSSQSVLILKSGSHLNIEAGSTVCLSSGAKLIIEGKAKITGNIVLEDGALVEIIDDAGLVVNNSTLNVHPATSISIGKSGELTIGVNSSLILDGGIPVMLGDNASIIVKDMASLISTNLSTERVSFRNSGDMWNAIMCEVGSRVELNGADVIGAYTGVWGAPVSCRITNSSFLNCENGISLVNCPDYVITNNRMIGKGFNSYGYAQGVGITLTSCSMPLSENTVQNYAEGIKLVSSSVIMAKNKLTNNFNSGLLITGHGSKPVLVNSLSKDLTPRLNNEIYGNNIDYPLYNGAQIYMRYSAGAYMTGGYNNIYSGLSGAVPPVPCIRGVINTTEPTINKVLISAERNYWGYGNIDEVNQPDFFFFRHSTFDTGYSIDFDPYALVPYTSNGAVSTELSTNEPRSTESTMLLNAMKLEGTGSSKASIKLYENIIKKYPNTPEYYVAESRLPSLYIEEEMPLAALFSSYDEAIENETALGKKFFKGLRVSTHIKAKNYDTAIMYAEEMKNEAETDEEALLSEIDIAVSNLMKESLGSGKGANSSNQLDKLLGMLNGRKESESSATDITETVLPSQHELFQNYPNPFNPVTQIKFALAKTADVKLSVYNIAGQKVAELANGIKNAGYHTAAFDGSRFNSGVYYYSLEIDGKNITKKMLLTK